MRGLRLVPRAERDGGHITRPLCLEPCKAKVPCGIAQCPTSGSARRTYLIPPRCQLRIFGDQILRQARFRPDPTDGHFTATALLDELEFARQRAQKLRQGSTRFYERQ